MYVVRAGMIQNNIHHSALSVFGKVAVFFVAIDVCWYFYCVF